MSARWTASCSSEESRPEHSSSINSAAQAQRERVRVGNEGERGRKETPVFTTLFDSPMYLGSFRVVVQLRVVCLLLNEMKHIPSSVACVNSFIWLLVLPVWPSVFVVHRWTGVCRIFNFRLSICPPLILTGWLSIFVVRHRTRVCGDF